MGFHATGWNSSQHTYGFHDAILYDTMFYNSGNGFKASTEKSMTPVTGLNVFAFRGFLHRANPTKATCVKMVLGETMVSSNLLDRASDSYSGHWPGETGSMQAVVQLWKGGAVVLVYNATDNVRWRTTAFSAVLLQPDCLSVCSHYHTHTFSMPLGRRVGMS